MNLIIRKIIEFDLPYVNEIRNLSSDFLHHDDKFTIHQTREWFYRNGPDWWSILNQEDNQLIGYFRVSDWSKKNKNLYIGADIHPDFRGRGIASRVYPSFMKFLFLERDLNKISLEVLSTNERAHHLYKKLGFRYDGTKRQEIMKNGRWIDSIMMSILKSEFFEKNKIYDSKITVCGDMSNEK